MPSISHKWQKFQRYPLVNNRLRIIRVQEVKVESPTVNTLMFADEYCAKGKPGQFVMIWIPDVDEVPMSLSGIGGNGLSSISVAKIGEATGALHNIKRGDILGLRGPFGNSFTLTHGRVLIVGGGIGLAPLLPLAQKLARQSGQITFLMGAKTRDELLFLDRIERMLSKVNGEIVATTEDGTYGLEGLVTTEAKQRMEDSRFDMIYTCGPEKMIRQMLTFAEQENIPLQACVERAMRCAIGICGSCVIGKLRVCKAGPVLTSNQLKNVKDEFGIFRRDFQGRITTVE